MCLAQGHNTVTPVKLGPASPVLSQALYHCALTNFEKTFNFGVWEELDNSCDFSAGRGITRYIKT